jgi:HD-like signal output (HDOD) protein
MLTFPTYLLKTGRVPPLAMAEAIIAQRDARPILGELAVQRGKLTPATVDKILAQQRRRKVKIGQAAIAAGALTVADVETLLSEQSSLEPDLVDVLVERGVLSRDVAEGERERFRAIEEDVTLQEEARTNRAAGSFACSVAMLRELRPFSTAVRDALDLLARSDVAPAKVAEVLSSDPAITVATLRVANSAMYRRGKPSESLTDAVVRLGASTVRDLVTGLSLLGLFMENDAVATVTRQHLAGTAAIARCLAGATVPRLANLAFLAGLLHDVGKLLLLQSGEFSYDATPREALERGNRLHLLEEEALGYDHAVLGGLALALWDLPKPVAEAVAWHHEPTRAHLAGGDTAILTALVVVAGELDHHQALSAHYTSLVAKELENHSEASFLGLDPSTVEEVWVELVQARAEMTALLAR